MKNKKLMAALLAATLIAGAFAGCTQDGGGGDTSSGNGSAWSDYSDVEGAQPLPETLENPNLTIVYWYNKDEYESQKEQDPNIYDPILEAIPDFEAKYGGEVEVVYTTWGNMITTATNMQNSGEAPDLIEVYDRVMHNVIFSGLVRSIDDYVTDEDYSYYKVDRSFFSWKGSTYAIPVKPYLKYIMYNKDLFDLAGLTYPDVLFREGKWNWDEFEKAAQALTVRKDGNISQYGFGGWAEIFNQFIVANGSSLLKIDNAAGTAESNLKSAQVQTTISKFRDWLGPTGFIMIDDNDSMFDSWNAGQLAMIVGQEFPNTNPFEVGMAPLPSGPDAPSKSVYVYPQAFAVTDGADNPEGAVAFMRLVNNKQLAVGDAKEAARYGQENYDMIYADDVTYLYAYDTATANIDKIVSSIINMAYDQTPAATIVETIEPQLVSDVELVYGRQ